MDLRGINNYFGDMDLFLMDWILKGKVPPKGSVFDAGCGEGRNAIYFLKENYEYLGVDTDESKVRLAQYMANNISTSKARFEIADLRKLTDVSQKFDLIICSRVLHFCENEPDFFAMWKSLTSLLADKGLIYVSMDSVMENTLGREVQDGKYEFPDGVIRFSLTPEIYDSMKAGLEEVEPLKTLIRNNVRAQSFFLLRKS